MKARLLLVGDPLEGAIPSMAHVLRDPGLSVPSASALQVSEAMPAAVAMLRIRARHPAAPCWDLHWQGGPSVPAVTLAPNAAKPEAASTMAADNARTAAAPALSRSVKPSAVPRSAGVVMSLITVVPPR